MLEKAIAEESFINDSSDEEDDHERDTRLSRIQRKKDYVIKRKKTNMQLATENFTESVKRTSIAFSLLQRRFT